MDRSEKTTKMLEFLDVLDERHPEGVNVRIACIAQELDLGDHLYYMTGFAGEDRGYVREAFLERLLDIAADSETPVAEDD